MQQENDTAADTIRSLEENVSEEKQGREDAEQELLKQKKVQTHTLYSASLGSSRFIWTKTFLQLGILKSLLYFLMFSEV